jgi:dihydroorotate dehydrogenase electron transfer subunit
MLQVGPSNSPLLKRPFSLLRPSDGRLHFLYRIRGEGTRSLSHFRSGDVITLIGPLGEGYPEPEGDFIAVAGGIGVASLFYLLVKYGKRAHLFYGARDVSELVMLDDVRDLAGKVSVATDNGSAGLRGIVTDIFAGYLESAEGGSAGKVIYACGPSGMLRALADICQSQTCFVSLEERMACGVGACVGCVVQTVGGFRRVCKEGPVFDLRNIVWPPSP